MAFEDIYEEMKEMIRNGLSYEEAEDWAGRECEEEGIYNYDDACESLRSEYDNDLAFHAEMEDDDESDADAGWNPETEEFPEEPPEEPEEYDGY